MKIDTVLLFSGGLDSTYILLDLLEQGKSIHCLLVDYGQPHKIELEQAEVICKDLKVTYEKIKLPNLSKEGDIFSCRNLIFLTYGKVVAEKVGASSVNIGVCANDESGFPDCREGFIKNTQQLLDTYYGSGVKIQTPVINTQKKDTISKLTRNGQLGYITKMTHTCYKGVRELHDWGYGCGECTSCTERMKSYKEAL